MIDFSSNYSVHFIGIGGVSMHNLALFCLGLGWRVTGSDIKENKYTKVCENSGIQVFYGHKKTNIGAPNFIVKTGGIKEENVELAYAKMLGIKVYDRAEFLGEITKQFNNVIAVAGSHGKSTTASMIYEILTRAGKKVSCHIGADVVNARLNLKDEFLVVEACEYNKSFLKLKVDIGAITNVEADHLECYGGFHQLKLGFLTFLKHAKKRYVIDCDSTKFINLKNLFRVGEYNITNSGFSFCGKDYVLKNLIGEQYVLDACLAINICNDLNINYNIIYEVLKDFRPLNRRQEVLGKWGNTEVIIDYAHHPTEIAYLKKAFNSLDTLYVFQPHTFSRTKFLKKDFLNILKDMNVIVFKEYSARERIEQGMSSKQLYDELKLINPRARYASSLCGIKELVKNEHYDKILFVGAGDINEVAERLVDN